MHRACHLGFARVSAIAFLLFVSVLYTRAQVLQTNHATRWITNVTVGVRGGIPTRNNLVPVTAFTQAAIESAISAASSNDVVYLSNGTYVVDSAIFVNKSGITIRGESRDGVILLTTNAANGMLVIGGNANGGTGTNVIINTGYTKGSTNITLAGASEALAGDVINITMRNPVHPTFKVIGVDGSDYRVAQVVIVDSISNGTNVNFSPPLAFDFTNSPVMYAVGRTRENAIFTSKRLIGVENITLTQSNTVNGMKGSGINMLVVNNAADCWVTGVKVTWPANYSISVENVAHFYYASNDTRDSQSAEPSSNNSGLLLARVSGGLFENSIFANRLFPAIEFNGGVVGDAFFGNFFTNNFQDIQSHNTHPLMNLWEANNIQGSFLADGYFGSASHNVIWRNAVGSVVFKRWTTYNHVVGNVIGVPGATYTSYQNDVSGQGAAIIQRGRPNVGNDNYIGTNPPTSWNWPQRWFAEGVLTNRAFTFTNSQGPTTNLIGDFSYVTQVVPSVYPLIIQDGANTNRYFVGTNGTAPLYNISAGTTSNLHVSAWVTVSSGDSLYVAGQTAYQQLQSTDRETDIVLENYDYYNNGKASTTSSVVETSILYTNGWPGWWPTQACRWPFVNVDAATRVATNPPQARFYASSGNTPGATISGNTRITGNLRIQ